MLLNSEELLALVNGDAEPDRLADLLERLEHCPDSAETLQVLVSLRANREEALEALRTAEHDVPSMPAPHPAARRVAVPSMGWALQGLRMAAAVAMVAVISVWATTYFTAPVDVAPQQTIDTTGLATNEFANLIRPGGPRDAELTSADRDRQILSEVYDALQARDFVTAERLLEGQSTDSEGKIPMYRGLSRYFLGKYQAALEDFLEVRRAEEASATMLHQAAWYEANALLKLDRPTLAAGALERVKSDTDFWFHDQAVSTYGALREALGWTPPRQD